MENLHRRINKEMQSQSTTEINNDILNKKQKKEKAQIISDFNIWLDNIKNSMHLCKYRQVIGEIEHRKNNFKSIKEYHWKYQYIEIDAIFKIIKKKFIKAKKDISKENSHQYHSCLFWFNQIFLLLEKLVLELRPDLNPKIDFNNITILEPIQCVIDSFIKFIYLLLIFGQYNQQLPDILAYISFIDRLVPFMKFTSKSSSYIFLQKIQLFKVKILAQNCEYMSAVDVLEDNIDFCLEYIRFLSDEDFNAYIFDFQDEKSKKYIEYLNKRRLFKRNSNLNNLNTNFVLRTNIVLKNNYKNKRYILSNNPQHNSKNKENISSSSKSKTKYNKEQNKIQRNKISKKEENKLNSSFSNNNTNSTNNYNNYNNPKNLKKKTITDSKSNISEKSKNLKLRNAKSNINMNKSLKKNILENNESTNTKKVFFITQPQKISQKKMDKEKQRIIEEIFANITLNFYLRGAIFEHVGNIDSALDSYKECEWFSIKFLTKRYYSFVKYMSSLLNCAWSNYNLISKLRIEKEKIKQKNLIIKKLEQIKKLKKKEAEERQNEAMMAFRSHRMKQNKQRLRGYLDDLGNKIYKEEEQRNFNIYNKFTKTGYILSTYKMIGNLLSDDFRKILKNMKKVEVTKPTDEIQDLIDKKLIKQQQNLSAQKEKEKRKTIDNNSNNYNNNINNNKINDNINDICTNTRVSSAIFKESNNEKIINDGGGGTTDIKKIKKFKEMENFRKQILI